jgi:hypothetical protein
VKAAALIVVVAAALAVSGATWRAAAGRAEPPSGQGPASRLPPSRRTPDTLTRRPRTPPIPRLVLAALMPEPDEAPWVASHVLTAEERARLEADEELARQQAAAAVTLSPEENEQAETAYRQADSRRAALEARIDGAPADAGVLAAFAASERELTVTLARALGPTRARSLRIAERDAHRALPPRTEQSAAYDIVWRRRTLFLEVAVGAED